MHVCHPLPMNPHLKVCKSSLGCYMIFCLKHKRKANFVQEGNQLMAQSRDVFGNQALVGCICSKHSQHGLNKGNIILSYADGKIFFIPKKSDETEVCPYGWQFVLTGDVCKPQVETAKTIKVNCWKDTAKKENRRENDSPWASDGNYLQCQCWTTLETEKSDVDSSPL